MPPKITPESWSAGVLLVVLSAGVFRTVGIFTKSVETAAWGVIFWRGISASLLTLAYLAARGWLWREIRQFNLPAFAVTVMMALGMAAFIPAFKLSGVANVALIYAAARFWLLGLRACS